MALHIRRSRDDRARNDDKNKIKKDSPLGMQHSRQMTESEKLRLTFHLKYIRVHGVAMKTRSANASPTHTFGTDI